jgi:ectoine hydroxylase-related dioxygenase (phytanoyl-CoA dioxygenase family)
MEEELQAKALENIQNNGFTILRNAVSLELVDKVVSDFNYWSSIESNNFKPHNFDRVTNFHMYSQNTLDLVTNNRVNLILNALFNEPQCVYSSLFFRESTQQDYHRDTPHFYTNPIDKYYGVWYSLEDININAGPLKYIIGSHKITAPDGYYVFNTNENKDNLNCLLKYNKNIEDTCKSLGLIEIDETNYANNNKINKGDVIIWHPGLLHGGSNILDTTLTRYSMVTHNVPTNQAVFNASHFFRSEPSSEYITNKCNFEYICHNGINIVNHKCLPKVQKTYI